MGYSKRRPFSLVAVTVATLSITIPSQVCENAYCKHCSKEAPALALTPIGGGGGANCKVHTQAHMQTHRAACRFVSLSIHFTLAFFGSFFSYVCFTQLINNLLLLLLL